jgi:SMC interacting uncharacterized protein involved in chromosome segregation
MMAFQDITMRSKSIIPSSKDFKDILKAIHQENQKSISRMQKYFDRDIMDKNKEISCLKEHRQKLLTQVKKSKTTKESNQRLEQEKENLEKEFKKHLSELQEESVYLKNLNQGLLEQIRSYQTSY